LEVFTETLLIGEIVSGRRDELDTVIFSQIWGYFEVNLPGEWGVVVFGKALNLFSR